ncbi:MAG: glycosyltransferase [Prevotella sp.]|jgi:glycosyltransferase involved in cell wall biosynthesis|nr:glycosyltransferase [Prevotella sp.]
MPEFSLIIPVYNVQDFLAECLDSCINQTFKDIEIICINDCSPDDSYKILEQYVKNDFRIKVITHTQNRGLGGARNTGIEAATGKYCWFIDSDDSILLNACEILHSVITKTAADIIRFSWINYYYDTCSKTKSIIDGGSGSWPYDILLTKKDFTKLDVPTLQAWAYITRYSLLKSRKFRENVVHEDDDFTPILFAEANSIYCVNYTLYSYRRHLQSITKGGDGSELDEKRTIDKLLAVNVLCDYIISSNLPEDHFCVQIAIVHHTFLKKMYKKFREIHTKELDTIIKKGDKINEYFLNNTRFKGNTKLYDQIITRYGNTRMLEFILKVYQFIICRTGTYCV